MRRLFTLFAAVLLTATVWAQSPEKMSYQAVVRDADDNLLTGHGVGMQISILQGSETGTAVYVERHFPTTNTNGLLTLEIGDGTTVSGSFAGIDWANGPYFIKSETDLHGGANYTITGTKQLLSVPYALHSKTAETVTGGITESDPTVPAHVKAITTDNVSDWNEAHGWGDHSAEGYATKNMNNEKITNLADPANSQDAATKAYVDANAPATYEIGDLAHGGIVFYVEPCGTKGLVAATEDQSTGIKWRGGSTNYATMARGDKVYAGKMNTSIIIAVHSAKNDFDNHAALLAANYTGGDFGDWYLPSIEELKLMHDNLHQENLGGFANNWYWSSSESYAYDAWYFNFSFGITNYNNKSSTYYVRAVRAF